MATIKVGSIDVRIDSRNGYYCITDLAGVKGRAADNIKNWMRAATTVLFFEAWEKENNSSKVVDFDHFKRQSGDNTFSLSATQLIEIGCVGIMVKRGRYGGTYCHIDWAIHFANWMSAAFYVQMIKAARINAEALQGKGSFAQILHREFSAKTYGLVTQANDQRKLPTLPDPMTRSHEKGDSKSQVKRHLKQRDADIINVAIWGLTAKQWRTRFPLLAKGRKNMRDYATKEELETLTSIQIIMRELQEQNFTEEEKLQHLQFKAAELIEFYCDTDQKRKALIKAREARGW